MAAEDPFDIGEIDRLNRLLRAKCPYLSFFYERTPSLRGQYMRKIGIHYNKKVDGVVYENFEVSYIELDANLHGELPILYSSTVDDTDIKFNKRKLNVCLRLLAGMIAATEGVGLRSVATNPISLYTMVKYFDCTIQKVPGENADINQCKTLEKCIILMEQARPDDSEEHDFSGDSVSVSIKTKVPVYEEMLGKLKTLITELNCAGLGGTRKRKKRTKRSLK